MIRHAQIKDLDAMMTLVHQAQQYFKNHGINQWQDGYPNEDTIKQDILDNKSYIIEDDSLIGMMYFAIEDDITYQVIEQGNWLTQQPYAVIHRIVVDENKKGQNYALELLKYAERKCLEHHIGSIRIDTHHDNLSMQRFLKKNGFQYCGIIHIRNHEERIAFEKIIKTAS